MDIGKGKDCVFFTRPIYPILLFLISFAKIGMYAGTEIHRKVD